MTAFSSQYKSAYPNWGTTTKLGAAETPAALRALFDAAKKANPALTALKWFQEFNPVTWAGG